MLQSKTRNINITVLFPDKTMLKLKNIPKILPDLVMLVIIPPEYIVGRFFWMYFVWLFENFNLRISI